MPHTGDNNKKKQDKNALRAHKNEQASENARQGKHSASKEPDHI